MEIDLGQHVFHRGTKGKKTSSGNFSAFNLNSGLKYLITTVPHQGQLRHLLPPELH